MHYVDRFRVLYLQRFDKLWLNNKKFINLHKFYCTHWSLYIWCIFYLFKTWRYYTGVFQSNQNMPPVLITYQRSTVQYSLYLAPLLRLLFDSVHMIHTCDILLYEGYHYYNAYTFIKFSLLNNNIPRLGGCLNYCLRANIRFLTLICLSIT